MHSFRSVEHTGLLDLAQACVEIGSQHGQIDIRDVWFGRNTIQSECVRKFKQYRTSIETLLRANVQDRSIAATTDLWRDDYVGRYYLDFTVL
jgi:hypothetical protein